MGRFKDDIKKTFTLYALIPVALIAVCSYFIFLAVLYYTVSGDNSGANARISAQMADLVSSYMQEASAVVADPIVADVFESREADYEIYERLYDFVNSMEVRAQFFIFDKDMNALIASSVRIPQYAQQPGAASWGVIRALTASPDKTSIHRHFSESPREQALTIGRTIVLDGEIAGFLTFDLDEKDLTSAISRNAFINTFATDRFGYILAGTNRLFIDDLNKIHADFRGKSGFIHQGSDHHYVTRTEILGGAASIYTITLINYFNTVLTFTGILLICLLGFLVFTTLISAEKFSNSKTKAIDDIIGAIVNVENGDLNTQLNIRTNDEFQIIAESYNQMLSGIQNLIAVNQEKAEQNILSEIKQLESQFNPHFLFNTLEIVKYMVKSDPASAQRIIVSLSELLRYSINKVSQVTLGEDIRYTQNYIQILQYRYNEKFSCTIQAGEQVYDCIVPKLIVQPLIENAVIHGFENRKSLSIRVTADITDANLAIVIHDDGAGIKPGILEELRQILANGKNTSGHVGLFNVHRRIQMMYGEAYGVDILSQEDSGTVVKIVLPVNYE